MPDTIRSLNDLLALFADGQPPGAISPQDVRDLIVSALPAETLLPYAAVVAWNLSAAPIAAVTLTGPATISVSGGENGRNYRLAIRQGPGGPHAITLGGNITLRGQQIYETAEGGVDFLSIDVTQGQYFGVVV